jgi:hypothetical protein
MVNKICLSVILLGVMSNYALASCGENSGTCSLYDGHVQTGHKNEDSFWNKKVEAKKEPGVARLESLYSLAKNTGEEALSSTLHSSVDGSQVEGIAETWCLKKDLTFGDNMKDWVTRAHWNMQWTSEFDYPIDAGFCISGSFQQAISTVAGSYMTAQQVLRVDVYPKQTMIVFSTK